MKHIYFYETSLGEIAVADNGEAVTHVHFGRRNNIKNSVEEETELTKRAAAEIDEYLKGLRKTFDVALAPAGTEFQQQVWQALLSIPYGQTRSYREIAEAVGRPRAYRAVGMANNRNPIAVIIPCHRVIGAQGKLIGYAGGLKVKEMLLNLERSCSTETSTEFSFL